MTAKNTGGRWAVLVNFVIPTRSKGWAYPLLKWQRRLKSDGIDVKVSSRVNMSLSDRADVVILTSYYYRSFYPNNIEFFANSRQQIINDIRAIRRIGSRIIYYELGANSSSRQLWPIQYVDLLLKRQLLRDKAAYTSNSNPHLRFPWVVDDDRSGDVCKAADLPRLQLGWNLGYSDYRTNNRWLKRLNFQSFRIPRFTSPNSARPYLTSFRGGTGGGVRGVQRSALIALLKDRDDSGVITGGRLSRGKFFDELRRCRAIVSPFGHGEICYRDFESFVVGAALIKPSVEHLSTFPNAFVPGKTYLPCRWDLADLPDILDKIENGRIDIREIAEQGQALFVEQYFDYRIFSNHLKSLLRQAID